MTTATLYMIGYNTLNRGIGVRGYQHRSLGGWFPRLKSFTYRNSRSYRPKKTLIIWRITRRRTFSPMSRTSSVGMATKERVNIYGSVRLHSIRVVDDLLRAIANAALQMPRLQLDRPEYSSLHLLSTLI